MTTHGFDNNDQQNYIGAGDRSGVQGELAPNSILLVDDEKEICLCLGKILESAGHSVLTCTNPHTSLDYYKKHYMSIALVIIDVVMPKMNGSDLFLEMKSVNPAIKAIMISGQCNEDVVTKCLTGGALEFVRKPFTATEIIGVVDRHALTSQSNLG
ncbi:MAG: response regulator [Phycisphaerales bacterium]|jgi:two-component system, cell cycle sensor histidine kinase and response regulator CckA|nr:response regulator [Phycisphaerales bacterium]